MDIKKSILSGLSILVALLCIIWITRFIPPLQSPDENVHLLRADIIAHGQLLLQPRNSSTGREGGLTDTHFSAFVSSMLNIANPWGDKSLTPKLIQRAHDVDWSHTESFVIAAGTGYYLPFIYAPHAAGLFIARQLNISMLASYELTRGLVVVTSIGILALAFSIYMPNALTLVLLLTPMSLFQLASPTIDGISAALAILLLSLWIFLSNNIKKEQSKKIFWMEFWLYACIFILCTARTNMLPTLLIPLILLKQAYTPKRLAAILALYALTLGWIAFAATTTYDARVVRELSTSQIVINYLTHPWEFFTLLWDTIRDTQTRKFYRDSYIGILGWLDVPVPKKSIRILSAMIVITILVAAISTQWREKILMRSALFAIGFLSILLIFFALAVTWNLYPIEKISGVQGRYFIIPTLFLATMFGKLDSESTPKITKAMVIPIAFGAYSIYILISTLSTYYKM